jgi:choline dehydrogenase-like flavoprotein
MNENTPLYSLNVSSPQRHSNNNIEQFDDLEFDIEDDFSDTREPDKRRWSVLTKLQNRHYMGQIRSYTDCCRILSCKCLLATGMLVAFIVLLVSVPEYFVRMMPNGVRPDDDWNDRFDFIIVGAGAAGALLASQLSVDGFDILLLEAGGNNVATQSDSRESILSPLTEIPFMWSTMSQFPQYTWQGPFNVTNSNSSGLGQILLGKGVGGSELLSSMTYVRALKSDVSSWLGNGFEAFKNVTNSTDGRGIRFDFDNIMQAYIELEDHCSSASPDYGPRLASPTSSTVTTTTTSTSTSEGSSTATITTTTITTKTVEVSEQLVHGRGGLIPTTRPEGRPLTAVETQFLTAAAVAGIPFISDFNGFAPLDDQDAAHRRSDSREDAAFNQHGERILTNHQILQNSPGRSGRRPGSGRAEGRDEYVSPSVKRFDGGEVDRTGIGFYDFNIGVGRRSGSSSSLLSLLGELSEDPETAASKQVGSNGGSITVKTNAIVTAILLAPIRADAAQSKEPMTEATTDQQLLFPTYKSSGVRYVQDGAVKEAMLRSNSVLSQRAVILAAGAIGSPNLLMNSGIGPSSVLSQAGITTLVDSPSVGKHLKDHPMIGLIFSSKSTETAGKPVNSNNLRKYV